METNKMKNENSKNLTTVAAGPEYLCSKPLDFILFLILNIVIPTNTEKN